MKHVPEVDAEMVRGPDTVLIARRRRSLLLKCMCSFLLMSAGIEIALNDEPKLLGCAAVVYFGLCTLYWAVLLLQSASSLLEIQASVFWWLPPSEPETKSGSLQMHDGGIPFIWNPERLRSKPGVWDRELDAGV